MEPIFLSIDDGDGGMRIYPLSAFGYLSHNSRGRLHIAIGDRLWPLADCRTEETAIALEDALLQEIAATIREHRRLRRHQGHPALILDLNDLAYGNLVELQLDEDEAMSMVRADALIEARERDGETGYDGARRDHSIVDCRGGSA